VRERTIKMEPGTIPKQWPNGSGLYKEGTAHLKSDKGLIGRTVRGSISGRVRAWKYLGRGKYRYLGEYPDTLEAMAALRRWGN
jgi:hypothetical protein